MRLLQRHNENTSSSSSAAAGKGVERRRQSGRRLAARPSRRRCGRCFWSCCSRAGPSSLPTAQARAVSSGGWREAAPRPHPTPTPPGQGSAVSITGQHSCSLAAALLPAAPLPAGAFVPTRCWCNGPMNAADAMAEALGVADLHRGLRGSLLGGAPAEAAVQRTRGLLRAALRSAWSQEALRCAGCPGSCRPAAWRRRPARSLVSPPCCLPPPFGPGAHRCTALPAHRHACASWRRGGLCPHRVAPSHSPRPPRPPQPPLHNCLALTQQARRGAGQGRRPGRRAALLRPSPAAGPGKCRRSGGAGGRAGQPPRVAARRRRVPLRAHACVCASMCMCAQVRCGGSGWAAGCGGGCVLVLCCGACRWVLACALAALACSTATGSVQLRRLPAPPAACRRPGSCFAAAAAAQQRAAVPGCGPVQGSRGGYPAGTAGGKPEAGHRGCTCC